MRRSVLAPVLTVAALLVVLLYASRIRSNAPAVPVDIFHNVVIKDASCTTCHTPGRQAPLKLSHAPVTDCLNCHHKRTRE